MTHRDRQPGLGLTLIAAIVALVFAAWGVISRGAVPLLSPEAQILYASVLVIIGSALVLFKWMPYGLNMTLKFAVLALSAYAALLAFGANWQVPLWAMVLATIGAIWNLLSRKGHEPRRAPL